MHIVFAVTVLLLAVPTPASKDCPPPDSTVPGSTTYLTSAVPQQEPRSRHAVYFGTAYQPGTGPRLTGTYEFAGLPSGVLSSTIGWSEQIFGEISYQYKYPFSRRPSRGLLASTTLFSDFAPNRLLDGTSTDERRTGGRLRLSFPGRNSPGPFQFFTEAQYARVRLVPESGSATSHTLTTVDLGGQYRWVVRPLRPDVVAGVQGRMGWPKANLPYVTVRAAGRYFHPFGSGWAGVVEGRVRWATSGTPRFEQSSVGGMTGVRGYRPDAEFGRTVWTLQNEVWAPVPGLSPNRGGLRGRLGRYVRLAGFFDVGQLAVSDEAVAPYVRTGLGLGLRLLLGPVTLRIDWGHRTPAVIDGSLRGDLYVSAQSSVSLFLFQ